VDLAANIQTVQARIRAACERAGRDPASVALLAVAKTHPADAVQAAVACGLTWFGENKVQEAKAKIPLCPGKLRWHLVGHLQTNKARDAVEWFEMIQSVDSLRLAEEINKRAEQASKRMAVLLEVNLAGEASKFGYAPERLLAELKDLNALPRLEIHGLMTVPPWSPVAENVRPHFRRLRELKERAEAVLGAPLPQLSMGMTGDFEVGIEEGATIVRIGTAIFGERSYAQAATTTA
jgi:PLP dependent protein